MQLNKIYVISYRFKWSLSIIPLLTGCGGGSFAWIDLPKAEEIKSEMYQEQTCTPIYNQCGDAVGWDCPCGETTEARR